MAVGLSVNTESRLTWKRVGLHAVLIAGAFLMVYPLLWMASSSIKPPEQIFANASLWPGEITASNYIEGWTASAVDFGKYFINSLLVCAGAIVGNVVACSLAAYAFARINFRFRRLWFAVMLGTIMLPYHVLVVPQYFMFHQLRWIDTFLPLIVPKLLATDAFFIFLLVQFIRGIPRELDQAAAVDGCGYFQTFWKILLPLMRPALVTTAAFTFIWTYNDFFTQLIYLNDIANYTVPLGLKVFLNAMGESSFGPLLAMSALSLVPPFLFFVIFQRHLVEGIATTGLKG